MRTLAFDPGLGIGFAEVDVADRSPVLQSQENLSYADFNEWLKLNQQKFAEAELVVIEEYKIRPGKAMAHTGSKVETARAIGAIKLMADLHGCKVVMSDAANNKINLKLAGPPIERLVKELPHSHTHWCYAYAHAVAILHRLRLIK